MSVNDELQIRKDKLESLQRAGVAAYPERFERNTTADQLVMDAQELPDLESVKQTLQGLHAVAGRVMTWREHGKLVFAHIQDESGQVQVAFSQDVLGVDNFKLLHFLDRGDWLGVHGDMFMTQKGEETVLVKSWEFLGKALRPLPEKWHGVKDTELKYRQRYLDLTMNQDTRERFVFRSNLIKALREFYWQEHFFEVETPTLMHGATGANAAPYETHNNALDLDLVLRISHELPLKELIVGGFAKVFELGKAFRNEGFDPSHLPEHTHLEHYAAFWNWEDNVAFTEKMFSHLFDALQLDRKRNILDRDGNVQQVNFSTPFERVDYIELLKKDSGLDITKYTDADALRKDLQARGIAFEGMEVMGVSTLVDNIYKKVSRPKIINPTILYHYPDYMQPLARRNDTDQTTVDQFQLVVNGWEVVKAYSELVDPQDQAERFAEQAAAREAGDDEAMAGDDEYIVAMEYGMPPISGWGMGVDRLVALLTQQPNLRDVVLFPLMRPLNVKTASVGDSADLTAADTGMSREEAWQFVQEKIKNPNLQKHALAVEFVMQVFARHFNENEIVWGITGLLHDVDYEEVGDDLARHCLVAEEWLQEKGLHPVMIQAIKAHNYSFDEPKDNYLAKTLYAVEELTGIITACALVQPDKKLASVSVASVKKKFKQKSFAAGVNRDIIKESEELLGLELEQVFAMTLEAMQANAGELGL